MASCFYDKILRDYSDLENRTNIHPGFLVHIVENDGGVGLCICPANSDIDSEDAYYVFMDPKETEELIKSLTEAYSIARNKTDV